MNEFVLDSRLAADTQLVGDLQLSRLLLMNDARFPWLILVPRHPNLRDLIDLAYADQHTLLDEIDRCARALQALDQPDKLNIASLGNVVAQLHVHVIARHAHDAAWPRPVWNVGEPAAYSPEALRARITALRTTLRIDDGA